MYVTGELTKTHGQRVDRALWRHPPGTVPQYGAISNTNSDIVVAKYTDQGNSAAVSWTQIGGGTRSDYGQGIAVRGTNVYATGFITNSVANPRGYCSGEMVLRLAL